jgi:hypothetical protein
MLLTCAHINQWCALGLRSALAIRAIGTQVVLALVDNPARGAVVLLLYLSQQC